MVATRLAAVTAALVVLMAVGGVFVAYPVTADDGVDDPTNETDVPEDEVEGEVDEESDEDPPEESDVDDEGADESESDDEDGGEYAMGYSEEEIAQPLTDSSWADVKDVEFYDDHAVVTIVADQPVTVVQPAEQYDELGDEEYREVRMTRDTIPSGETEIHVPLVGDDVFVTIDGATLQLSGDGGADRGLIQHLDATPALLLGAAAGLFGATYVAYRKTKKELEEPVKAREVWKR